MSALEWGVHRAEPFRKSPSGRALQAEPFRQGHSGRAIQEEPFRKSLSGRALQAAGALCEASWAAVQYARKDVQRCAMGSIGQRCTV